MSKPVQKRKYPPERHAWAVVIDGDLDLSRIYPSRSLARYKAQHFLRVAALLKRRGLCRVVRVEIRPAP